MSSIPRPLFPAYQQQQKQAIGKPAVSARDQPVPQSSSTVDPVDNLTSLPIVQCSSYRPELIEKDVPKSSSSSSKEPIILVSSSDNDSESDSDDCILVYENNNNERLSSSNRQRKERETKKLSSKKHRSRSRSPKRSKKKNKKHHSKKSRDNRDKHHHQKSTTRSSEDIKPKLATYDNDYLNYLPRGRANFLEDIPNLRQEDAYRIDRKPDNNNRAFGSLQHVPRYWFKEVLDFSDGRVEKSSATKKKKPKIKRYFTNRSSSLSSNNNNLFIFAKENLFDSKNKKIVEYIPVVEDAFYLNPEDSSLLIQNNNNSDNIRFKSMIIHEEEDGPNEEQNKSIGPKRFPLRSQLIHELKSEFNRSGSGSNVSKWIDFICFQDLIAEEDKFNDKFEDNFITPLTSNLSESIYKLSSSNSQQRYYIEKKLSIAEKGLERNCRSIALNLFRLRLVSGNFSELGMDYQEVDSEWKRLSFLFPLESRIWSEWIRFSIRGKSITTFKAISRTRKLFRQSFGSFSGKFLEGSIINQNNSDLEQTQKIEMILIDLTQFLAQFLDSIDQSEKALALFQALIEFNLFTPNEQLDMERYSFEDWYQLFEQFWDSGISRFGEFPSSSLPIGWNSFNSMVQKQQSLQESPIPEKDQRNIATFNHDSLLDQCENKILEQPPQNSTETSNSENSRIWLQFEKLRRRLHWIPANAGYPTTKSMEDIEDLERVVLTDEDLKPFLFRLRTIPSKLYLIENFLQYLHVNLITFSLDSAPSTSKFEYESIWDSKYLGNYFHPNSEIKRLLFCDVGHRRQQCFSRSSSIIEQFVLKKFDISNSNCCDLSVDSVVDSAKRTFVDNVLQQSIHYFHQCNTAQPVIHRKLVLIWIQHKLSLYRDCGLIKTKAMRNFIKDFLRQDLFRNCLDVWLVYCLFEYQLDPVVGRRYFCNTIQLMLDSTSNEPPDQLIKFALGFVRAELELDSIVDHFVGHRSTTSSSSQKCCSLGDGLSPNENYRFELRGRIALRVLISTICPSNVKSFGDIDWNNPQSFEVSPVEIVRATGKLSGPDSVTDDSARMHSLALLTYLSKGFDQFVQFIEHTIIISPGRSRDPRLLRSDYLLYLQLLLRHYHTESSLGSNLTSVRLLTALRDLTVRVLDHFPGDSLFLAILVTIETRSQFSSMFVLRRRFANYQTSTSDFEVYLQQRYLTNKVANNDPEAEQPAWITRQSIETFWNIFFATLYSELVMLEKTAGKEIELTGFDVNSGILNRIRHLFERALNYYGDLDRKKTANSDWQTSNDLGFLRFYGKSLEQCPTIWRMFLSFEINCQNRSKAKAIIYRALQNCPNDKQLYLDGIGHFPELLQEFVDIMLDKQLRIHTTIEEIELFRRANIEQQELTKSPKLG